MYQEMKKLKVKAKAIESDPAFQHYKEKHDLSESTWIGYLNALQRYSEYTGLTLSEAIEEAEAEEKEGIPLEKREIGRRLIGFRKHLKEAQLSPNSIKRCLAGVVSFYENGHSISIPKIGRDRTLKGGKIENRGIPTTEDIRKILKNADLREQVIILGIASSGLSVSDVVNIRVGTFKKGYDEETGITTLELRRVKTKEDFVTFFDVEATEAIREYLRWRDRPKPATKHPGILKGWQKHRIFTDDDFLICKKYISDEYIQTKDEQLRRESEKGLQTVFRSLCARAAISKGKGQWNMMRAHKLRSWFYSQLLNAGCPKEYAEEYMGHMAELGSSNGTYYQAIVPKLKNVYLNFMPNIALLRPVETKIFENEAYVKVKKEMEKIQTALNTEKQRREAGEAKINELTEILELIGKHTREHADTLRSEFTSEMSNAGHPKDYIEAFLGLIAKIGQHDAEERIKGKAQR